MIETLSPTERTLPAWLHAVLLILSGLIAAGVAGCSSDSSETDGDETAATNRQAVGDVKYGGIYRFNETDGIKTLDPVQLGDAPSHHVVHQLADLLVDFDENLELVPELAHTWEISDDSLTYTYHLRTDVRFHDSECFPEGKGRLMTAADVKYSFDRICDGSAKTKGVDFFRDKVVGAADYFSATADGATPEGGVPGFRVVDDSTFAIDLVSPFPPFMYYPTLGFCYVYPKEAVEHYGQDFERNLVATGPFLFKEWQEGREVYMERNPDYWGTDEDGNQLPYLDAVVISFIADQTTMLTEFRNGNLEENYRIPNDYVTSVFEPRKPGSDDPWVPTGEYKDFVVEKSVELSAQYYGMLTTSEAFSDVRVRQAFNYAVDRERIVEFVMNGVAGGLGHHGIVPPSMPGYPIDRVKGYTFDADRARELMAEAGYPNGDGFPDVTLQYNEGGGRNTTIAEAIQQELRKNIGVDVELKAQQWAQHIDRIDNEQAEFFRFGWIADYPSPENFLNLLYSKNARTAGLNATRYANPRFDSIFEAALATGDRQRRLELYAEAEQVAVDDAPMLWILYDMQFRLLQPYVRNYNTNAMNRIDLRAVWLDRDADA